MILISACLCGIHCRYDSKKIFQPEFMELLKNRQVIPVCPEQLGGLSTPRTACEIQNGDGYKVLDGTARVINQEGANKTAEFLLGAQETCGIAKKAGIKMAILKSRSPSCGCGKIYNGTFNGELTDGDGVTAALLKSEGITVTTDEEYLKNKEEFHKCRQ